MNLNEAKESFMSHLLEMNGNIFSAPTDYDRNVIYTQYMNNARLYGLEEIAEKEARARAEGLKIDLEELPEYSNKYQILSDVSVEKVQWLWNPYIPRGKITLITADPGTGKTFFALYLVAAISDGRPYYGQEADARHLPENAVYQTAEDGYADTIVPRLKMMIPPPDLTKVFNYDESRKALDFKSQMREIESIFRDLKPAIIIFDPLQAYLGADVDMHRANEVRPILAELERLAEKYKTAVVLIMHNSKNSQSSPLHRALGSIDFVGIARSMLILGKNPDDPKQVVICHEKSSLAANGQSILFHIDPENGGVVFDGFSEMRACDLLNRKKLTRDKPSVRLDEAVELLEELISEDGWTELSQVKELEATAGVSIATMKRAKQELNLQSVHIGFGDKKATYWIDSQLDKEEFKKNRLFEGAEVLLDDENLI